jgi:hypothetical protein
MKEQRELMVQETAVATPQNEVARVFDSIVRAMNTPGFDPQALERMYAFHRQMKADTAEDAYWQAMRECQLDMKPIQRKAWNPHTKSYFAKIWTIQEETKPIYERHGFGLSFTTEGHVNPRVQIMVCTVSHKAGHRQTYRMEGGIDDKGPSGSGNKTEIQGALSTSTQLRKKLFELIFDLILTDDDNDGNKTESAATVTAQQADTIRTMLTDLGSALNREAFFKFCSPDDKDIISRVDDIPAVKFDKVIKMLEAKARQGK